MSNNTEFKWTDALITEFFTKWITDDLRLPEQMQKFKESKQPKKVMFTTSDGIDIAIGDEYWYVTKDLKIYGSECDSMTGGLVVSNSRQGDVFFSTEESARSYILDNKQLFSLKEIRTIGNVGENNPYYKKLVALAESKLK